MTGLKNKLLTKSSTRLFSHRILPLKRKGSGNLS